MPDAIVPTAEAIDRLLGMLRVRLEQAFQNGQKVKAHIVEDRHGFSFTLDIETKKGNASGC